MLRVCLVIAAMGLPQLAQACARNAPAGANVAITQSYNPAVLDAAILAEANYQRCRKGLGALQAAPAVSKAAQRHANWMAKAAKLSHQSGVMGQRNLSGRLKAAKLRRGGAENIARLSVYAIDRQSFGIKGQCRFTINGKVVPPHSHLSLARAAVAEWMASPGHNRNLFDRRAKFVGTGAQIDPDTQYCGHVYFSQIFGF